MDRRYYQTGGITMANTLQQNLATNRAQASNIQNMLNAARRKAGLPTVQSSRQTTAAPSITTPTQTTAAPMRTSQSTQAPTLRQISSAILSGGNPMASPTQTSTPSMQQVSSQMMAPTTASRTYTIPEQSGPGMGPMGPMMADPLQVFSGLNQQQLSELPEQDFLALEKRFDALPQSEKDNIDKFITTSMDKQTQKFLADEKKFGSFADGRTLDIGAGRIAYNDLLAVFKNDYPAEFAKLTGDETLAELDQKLLDLSPERTFSSFSDSSTSGAGSNLDPVYTMSPSNVASFVKANPIYNTTGGRYYAGRNQFMKTGGRVGYQTGGITQSRTLPPEYVEALGKTYAADLTRQAGLPTVTTATTQQPGETAAQFAQRQAQAQQFNITRAGMAELAPQVAAQDPLQAAAYAQAIDPTKGLGSFQPFLTKATTAADAATALTGTGAGTGAGSIASYQSPYQQQVIDATLQEFDRQTQIQKAQQAANALGTPGAFGGGREGVLQAEFLSNQARNRANIQSNLLQQGFQNAAARRQQDLANQMSLSNQQRGLGAAAQDFSRAQISGLGTLGAAQQAQSQAILDAQRQAAQMAIQDPQRRLNMLGSGVMGLMGGMGAGRTEIGEAPAVAQTSPLQSALGFGLMGADIYGRIFGRG